MPEESTGVSPIPVESTGIGAMLLMAAKDMTDAFQNPHPEVPFASVGDDTVKTLADLAAIFKLKITASSVPCNTSFTCHNHSRRKPHSLTNPNLDLDHARQAENEITDDNSHSRHHR
jgi:hypothetical protein